MFGPYPSSNVDGAGPILHELGNQNFFMMLNDAILRLKVSSGDASLSGVEDDNDICIRAVLHGWRAAEQKIPMDPAWQLLRGMDQTFFCHAGIVERVAILRVTRAMLVVCAPMHLDQGKRNLPTDHAS
jgi:hypothetical protein